MNDRLRRSGNPSVQGARRKDMPGIFDDERRRTGGFQRGPSKSGLADLVHRSETETGTSPGFEEVGPKSVPNASKMRDGGRHRLALFSCSATISDTNAANR
jgi:hypothetical protein